MDALAAAFWGGFFTIATFMLAAAIGAAVRGFWRVAAVGVTYSVVPALFVCAYIGLLPIHNDATYQRVLAHVTVFGSVVLTSQLLLLLRGYRKPTADQQVSLLLLLVGCGVLVVTWPMQPIWGLWAASAYAFVQGLGLIGLALVKASRGNSVAWLSVAGIVLALVSQGSLLWIAVHPSRVPVEVHGLAATSSLGYVAIMGWALWMRYIHALQLKQVLVQGPSFDPVTRLPSHAQAGRLVGSFLRGGAVQHLGVVAVSLANLAPLEGLQGRAAYNHALFVCAGRLRRAAPLGAQVGRLGDDGFLMLMRTDDAELLKHLAAKLRRSLTQPINVGADLDAGEVQAVPTEWVAEVGIGITLSAQPDAAGSAVATARALSRAALAAQGRIVYSEARDAPYQEVT
jgi:GGDEF domain-containing protein